MPNFPGVGNADVGYAFVSKNGSTTAQKVVSAFPESRQV